MKKNTILCTLAGIACFSAGWFTSLKVNTDSVESAEFKRKLIEAQYDALEYAEKVMNNNDLWDTDGSDDMADFMDYQAKVDSLLRTQL